MEKQKLLDELKKKMEGAVAAFDHDLKGLRTGRASPNLLDSVVVEAYGDRMPLAQLATINVPESRLINVQVWDKTMVKAVEKAIANAELGLNPSAEGQSIRIPLPPLSEERRHDLVKLAHKFNENAKVALRNVRRKAIEQSKEMEKDSILTKDEQHNLSEQIQKVTDDYSKKFDNMASLKEKEILQN